MSSPEVTPPGHQAPQGKAEVRLGLLTAALLVAMTGGLGVFSASQDWLSITLEAGQVSAGQLASTSSASPVASSLMWVLLAAWGALLVTRGRVRRAALLVGMLSSLGNLLAAIRWATTANDIASQALKQVGATEFEISFTPWFWLGLLSAFLTLFISVFAFRALAGWPEMGQRYDAPDGASKSMRKVTGEMADEVDLTSGHDVWKAIDEGQDPTAAPDT